MLKAQLKAKRAEQDAILDEAIAEARSMNNEEQFKYNALKVEIDDLETTIAAQDERDARIAAAKIPATDPLYAEPKTNEGIKVFKNFAEQLKAVKNAASGVVDDRLLRLNNEFKNASGMNEGVGSEGGFAVQTDFAGLMLDTAAKSGQILPLVDKYEVKTGNGVRWVDIDETDVSTTVFGGVQVYWASEAVTKTASKPKLMEKELNLEKLLGFAYATYELDQDTNFVSDLYTRAFTKAIQRAMEAAIIGGTGKGQPTGLANSGALVSIAKEAGQAADTILWENLVKMYNRALDKNDIANYAWICHPDAAEQFDFLSFPIGVGGVPVYLSASSVGSVATLKGRPIIEADHCAALGDKGDIYFTNLNDYFMIYKGGVSAETSIHVAFLTAENCFRFIFRANGMPKRNSALTIKNSSNTRSSIITLDARA